VSSVVATGRSTNGAEGLTGWRLPR
jgi:hypothetical protein